MAAEVTTTCVKWRSRALRPTPRPRTCSSSSACRYWSVVFAHIVTQVSPFFLFFSLSDSCKPAPHGPPCALAVLSTGHSKVVGNFVTWINKPVLFCTLERDVTRPQIWLQYRRKKVFSHNALEYRKFKMYVRQSSIVCRCALEKWVKDSFPREKSLCCFS